MHASGQVGSTGRERPSRRSTSTVLPTKFRALPHRPDGRGSGSRCLLPPVNYRTPRSGTIRRRDQNPREVWSAERLHDWMATAYGGESIVVLANREPIRHDLAADGAIVARRSGGGLV